MLLLALLAAAASNVPELPKDIPPNATMYDVQILEKSAGQLAAWVTPEGRLRVFYQFNDRGRGDRTYSTITLDKDGVPVAEEIEGNDYMKAPVKEAFTLHDGTAAWKNKAEDASRKVQGAPFYLSISGSPLEGALLASAGLKRGGTIPLLPGGEARVQKLATSGEASLVSITGVDLSPMHVWLDAHERLFATVSGWFTIVRAGQEAALPALREAQKKAESGLAQDRARRLMHRPQGKLVIRDVAIFDAEGAKLEPHRDVLVEGNRIVSVAPTSAPPAGAQVIDGRGKTLLPGLWDMHAHYGGPNNGLLNLAAGVTTVRDMANDNDELAATIARIEKGEEIGNRIVRAGIIDGPGPFQGPTKMLAATAEEALKDVDWYADHGFVQIKLYSSIKPELVPLVAEEAHKRGLRLSGHVPAYMTAEQAVREGYDEIQHLNMLLLNFMPDVKDTRSTARFSEPARRTGKLDLNSPKVREFVRLLKERHVALDLTLGAMEEVFVDRIGQMATGYAMVADRLPVQVRRSLYAGALRMALQPGDDAKLKASWRKALQLVRLLWAAGVPIEAGTDSFPGFGLDRELELDVQAGIPAPLTLQLATLGAARMAGMDKDLGLVRQGKLADLVLIDGDPTKTISDVRKVALTIKDGVIYEPAELDRELGITPR